MMFCHVDVLTERKLILYNWPRGEVELNSQREKLLILLAEDIVGLSSDPCSRSGRETLQMPIYSEASIGISKVTLSSESLPT